MRHFYANVMFILIIAALQIVEKGASVAFPLAGWQHQLQKELLTVPSICTTPPPPPPCGGGGVVQDALTPSIVRSL